MPILQARKRTQTVQLKGAQSAWTCAVHRPLLPPVSLAAVPVKPGVKRLPDESLPSAGSGLEEKTARYDFGNSPEKAKKKVAKVAKEQFGGDYEQAYEYLKRDPDLWEATYTIVNTQVSYTYLPSVDDINTGTKSWPFDIPIACTLDSSATGMTTLPYEPIDLRELLARSAIDAGAQAEIISYAVGVGSVTLQAQLSFTTDATSGASSTTSSSSTTPASIDIENLASDRTNILEGQSAPRRDRTGITSSTEGFRLIGTVTVSGPKPRPIVYLSASQTLSKKEAIRSVYP